MTNRQLEDICKQAYHRAPTKSDLSFASEKAREPHHHQHPAHSHAPTSFQLQAWSLKQSLHSDVTRNMKEGLGEGAEQADLDPDAEFTLGEGPA